MAFSFVHLVRTDWQTHLSCVYYVVSCPLGPTLTWSFDSKTWMEIIKYARDFLTIDMGSICMPQSIQDLGLSYFNKKLINHMYLGAVQHYFWPTHMIIQLQVRVASICETVHFSSHFTSQICNLKKKKVLCVPFLSWENNTQPTYHEISVRHSAILAYSADTF
jgi:hypothetical protein